MNRLEFLRTVIRRGYLEVIAPGGAHRFGVLGDQPSVVVRAHDDILDWRRILDPDDGLCDAYADETITLEAGTIRDLLELLAINHANRPETSVASIPLALEHGRVPGDPPAALLATFLGADLQFSSAYFLSSDHDLDQAQQDKSRLVAGKLRIEP